MSRPIEVIGKTFGKLKVFARVAATSRKPVMYKARCECGNIRVQKICDIKANVVGCNCCRSKMKKKNTKSIRMQILKQAI